MRLPGIRGRPGGAAALEFALVLPLLLALVMGAIDWGFHFFVAEVVVNAAREGARAGSLETVDETSARSDAEATTRNYLTRGALDASKATVSVTFNADSVAVQVVYPTGSITGLNNLLMPADARGLAEMRR